MIEKIKQLREITGASIGEIQKALEESGGDVAGATKRLDERLGVIAGKKRTRELKASIVDAYIHSNGRIGVLIEVQCETDFVARNPEFRKFVHDVALHIAAMGPEDVGALLEQEFVKDPGRRVSAVLDQAIGRFGENITISRFSRFEV